VTVKNLGDGSGRLAGLRPGTRVLLEGPYGRLTAEGRVRTKVALIACGIGVTPMRALLEELAYAPGEAVLIYRARSEADLVLRAELDAIAAARGAVMHYVPGHRVPGRVSWLPQSAAEWGDEEALLHLVPDLADRDVFVCGPDGWMAAVRTAAIAAGVSRDHLHLERFAW
jgi:ferredoxin-NADP reductase